MDGSETQTIASDMKTIILLALVFYPLPGSAFQDSLLKDATDFMEAYARDLVSGNRESISNRYHPQGAYFLGNGKKEFEPQAAIVDSYLHHWQPPLAFEWKYLSFEVVQPNAVLVLGKFKWTSRTSKYPIIYSYSALLIRVDGKLKIRVEDESR